MLLKKVRKGETGRLKRNNKNVALQSVTVLEPQKDAQRPEVRQRHVVDSYLSVGGVVICLWAFVLLSTGALGRIGFQKVGGNTMTTMRPDGCLPRSYVIPDDDDCPICLDALRDKTDLVRLTCGHFLCYECLKRETGSFYRDDASRPTGARSDGRSLPCPKCRFGCDLIERIQKPSASATLEFDRFGGPFRDVTVGDTTWRANYYHPLGLTGGLIAAGPLFLPPEFAGTFTRQMLDRLGRAWNRLSADHDTVDATLEALLWDESAEECRALLRDLDDVLSYYGEDGCCEAFDVEDEVWVCGVVNRPEYNGLEGTVEEVMPPRTRRNRTDNTR
ncbi:unnamed protein product [Vitrella brassicaformis CCMP3155]|uniref:RING-type domain-containing protein n=1 Tax=Vitrella brassicaformis (strain CCMP3155) TaxID=1169540 RepID=A0A0G4EAU4_VITBC|nr:unnamed protein product [Vitrella brassicaformis CCMP3155]|eukprot:CEL93028.1 unnamed protein product [Vitrella brassicaformis CCMP3155]